MLVDEGSGTTDDVSFHFPGRRIFANLQWYGGAFAQPGMGEKGYLDIRISVGTAGGVSESWLHNRAHHTFPVLIVSALICTTKTHRYWNYG